MRLIDADEFEVVSLQGKSEEFCNGVMWMLEQIDNAPTIPAIELTGIEKHVSKFDFDDNRPQCCIDHNKWFAVCDICEFGEE